MKKQNQRGQEKVFGGDGWVYGINCDDSCTVFSYLHVHQVVYIAYLQL